MKGVFSSQQKSDGTRQHILSFLKGRGTITPISTYPRTYLSLCRTSHRNVTGNLDVDMLFILLIPYSNRKQTKSITDYRCILPRFPDLLPSVKYIYCWRYYAWTIATVRSQVRALYFRSIFNRICSTRNTEKL